MESEAESAPLANGDAEAGERADRVETEAEGGGAPMDLEEPLPSGEAAEAPDATDTEPSYVGDNCLSTESPQMDAEPDSEGIREGERSEADESPDQSVQSTGGADQGSAPAPALASSDGDSDIPLAADVASSDDVTPPDVSSGLSDAVQSGISSSTADESRENPAISSSDMESSDLLPSTSSDAPDCVATNNGPASVDALDDPAAPDVDMDGDAPTETADGLPSRPDTSAPPADEAITPRSAPIDRRPRFGRIPTDSIGHTAVSSSNTAVGIIRDIPPEISDSMDAIATLHHHVSSTSAETMGGDEGAVSSSMNSNGGTPANSVGARDAADALATLASAALNRQHNSTDCKVETKLDSEDAWYTVGIVKGTSFTVQNYIADPNVDLSNLTIDNIPDLSGYPVVPLDPGTGYKFRVAAINSCGRGEYGEESAFKTCVPGYPGAPSAIKITKSSEGAHLSWEPPQVSSEGIFEYSVYLAVKPSLNASVKDPTSAKSQLTFVRVYCGKANTCIVSQPTLGNAHVDNSTKPAIIFRIAARNEKGYGPATQVRWLQENKTTGVKRMLADGRSPGAPPPKQPKPNAIH